jgi:hypothetical protein
MKKPTANTPAARHLREDRRELRQLIGSLLVSAVSHAEDIEVNTDNWRTGELTITHPQYGHWQVRVGVHPVERGEAQI